jgi:hypothetical protein
MRFGAIAALFGAVFGFGFLGGDFADICNCFCAGRDVRPSFFAEVLGDFFDAEVGAGFSDAELRAGFSADADATTGFGRLAN